MIRWMWRNPITLVPTLALLLSIGANATAKAIWFLAAGVWYIGVCLTPKRGDKK